MILSWRRSATINTKIGSPAPESLYLINDIELTNASILKF